MQEIRSEIKLNNPQIKKTRSGYSIFIKFLFVLTTVGTISFAFLYFKEKQNYLTQTDAYSAVFLSNGQVYFGKMYKNSSEEIVLKDVYYLQTANNNLSSTTEASKFNLVKLGQELHGPTNELFINKASVLFYEILRDDSTVVKSIREAK